MYYGFSFIVTFALVVNGGTTYFNNGTFFYNEAGLDMNPTTGVWICPQDGVYLMTIYSSFQAYNGVTYQITSGLENIMNSNQHGSKTTEGGVDGFNGMNVRPHYVTAGTPIRAYMIAGFINGTLLSSYGVWTVSRLE